PSEVFHRHIYGCFIDDDFGARHLNEVGVDNVMLETDFPHGDSSFPRSMQNARERLGHYDEATRYKVMQGNARRGFPLDDFIETERQRQTESGGTCNICQPGAVAVG